jgi:alcohol dehydrogenase
MKAAQFSEYGDPSVLRIVEIDKPPVGDGQVLVEVHAASLNPFDTSVRAGYMKDMIPLNLPITLGGDIAGVIVEPGTSNFKVGEKVYGQANAVAGNSGAFAEYAATSASEIAAMPDGFDFKHAAALPLVSASARQALRQHINLQSGDKIFIHGGAGGIGSVAIQLAKHLGAYVASTANGANIEYVKSLGADEVIDYKNEDYAERLTGYDAVFDTVGDNFPRMYDVLRSGGTAVTMIAEVDEAKAAELDITAIRQSTHVTTEILDELRELAESGVIEPQIDQVFPLDQIKDAMKAREEGSVKGKIVISIKD